jgi:hypothetical protein
VATVGHAESFGREAIHTISCGHDEDAETEMAMQTAEDKRSQLRALLHANIGDLAATQGGGCRQIFITSKVWCSDVQRNRVLPPQEDSAVIIIIWQVVSCYSVNS